MKYRLLSCILWIKYIIHNTSTSCARLCHVYLTHDERKSTFNNVKYTQHVDKYYTAEHTNFYSRAEFIL